MTSADKRIKILIIDDDARNIRVLEAMLGTQLYQITGITSGAEALRQVASEAPDLILLDVMMPDMNGFEVLEKLKNNPLSRLIPIVIITSLDDRESRRFALQAGADEFLAKPVDRSELTLRVKNLLMLREYRRLMAETSAPRQ
jgi:putative two-component system response regulator